MILAYSFWLCTAATGVNASHRPSEQVRDTLRMLLVWEVVEGKHPAADSLGQLSGIAVDRAGTVYVSDFSAAKIWVFDRAGGSLPGIGRKGRGPGEFEAPTGLGIGPDGRLLVRDIVRVSRFSLDPATGRLTRYENSFQGPALSDWTSTRATRFDSTGHLYYPGFNTIDRSRRTGAYHRYTLDGVRVDSIVVPGFPNAPQSTASVRLSATNGRMLHGLNHVPFAPLPVWDVTPRGTLITGDGHSYLLRETDFAGRELRVYRRTVSLDAIPARERQDSATALRARLDSVPVSLDRVQGMPPEVRAVRLPQVFPAYMAVYAAADGLVWVRRWPVGDGERTLFDVFERDGRFRTVVILPRVIAVEPTPVLSLGGIVAIGIDRESGANTILRFSGPSGR